MPLVMPMTIMVTTFTANPASSSNRLERQAISSVQGHKEIASQHILGATNSARGRKAVWCHLAYAMRFVSAATSEWICENENKG